jgi:hypothetical protein
VSQDDNDVEQALRRARDEARRGAPSSLDEEISELKGEAVEARGEEVVPRGSEVVGPAADPEPPDPGAVNASWRAAPPPPRGLSRLLWRLLARAVGPHIEAQRTFNADQVRLDNETLRYLGERFAATHRHYDRLLGLQARRLDEVDERHALLQRDLVSHVRRLVQRIDLLLGETNRGRAATEYELGELRERLVRLEEALRRRT